VSKYDPDNYPRIAKMLSARGATQGRDSRMSQYLPGSVQSVDEFSDAGPIPRPTVSLVTVYGIEHTALICLQVTNHQEFG